MSLGVTIEVRAEEAQTLMRNMAAKARFLFVPLREAALVWTARMAHNFTGIAPPLAASTIARKQAGGYPLDPLVRTGALKDAATGGDWRISGGGSRWEASLDLPSYAGFHITGTRFMPARDFTMMNEYDEIQMAMKFIDWILEDA